MLLFFGGSFDPVHIGHLILARDAKEHLDYERVIFIPAYISPFKVKTGHRAPAEDRVNMLKIALSGVPYFGLDLYEVEKGGVSYTYDTVLYLKERYGIKEKVHWLMGDDTFLKFHLWHRWRELLNYLFPVVVLRNSNPQEVKNYALSTLGLSEDGFKLFTGRRLEISSTEIRERIRTGRDIKFLVPEGVEEYIKKKGLYKAA